MICRTIDRSQRLYMVSRHFLWMGPLSSLLLFLGMGLVLSVAVKLFPRASGMAQPSADLPCAILPVLMAMGPQIYPEAWALVGMGIAVRFVPMLERPITDLPRKFLWSFPVMVGLVILLASYIFVGDRLKQARESGRPLPPAGSPNVLLIVLDTVRADHLSLYGYERSTTPFLKQLARRGIRFDEARQPRPGLFLRMRACSTATGRASLVTNGRVPLRGTCRCSRNTWGTTAMRPRVLSPISAIVPRKPGWPAASLITKTTSWKNSLRSGLPDWWNSWPARFIK